MLLMEKLISSVQSVVPVEDRSHLLIRHIDAEEDKNQLPQNGETEAAVVLHSKAFRSSSSVQTADTTRVPLLGSASLSRGVQERRLLLGNAPF